jgi:flagellar biosynthesis/type III secretory pathway chaperone
MSIAWEDIAERLRAEAAEYGRLLQLIEEQQRMIFRRDVEGVLHCNESIQAQTALLQDLRRRREKLAAAVAVEQGRPAGATLRSLIPAFAAAGQPLLEALIGEINHLIHRVRRSLRLNRRLLAATLEVHQELLRRLRPDAFTKTYARDGRVSVAVPRDRPTMQAAG